MSMSSQIAAHLMDFRSASSHGIIGKPSPRFGEFGLYIVNPGTQDPFVAHFYTDGKLVARLMEKRAKHMTKDDIAQFGDRQHDFLVQSDSKEDMVVHSSYKMLRQNQTNFINFIESWISSQSKLSMNDESNDESDEQNQVEGAHTCKPASM